MSVSLTKISGYTVTPVQQSTHCSWCWDTATLAIKGAKPYDWTDLTCEHHAVVHFGASIVKPNPRCGTCGGRGCTGHDTDKDWAAEGDTCHFCEKPAHGRTLCV